jgi:hypothetical protein
MVTFMPSDEGTTQELCGIVPINNDMIGNEPNEEFSVTLVSSDPPGAKFGDKESCITIIDDDGERESVWCAYMRELLLIIMQHMYTHLL